MSTFEELKELLDKNSRLCAESLNKKLFKKEIKKKIS